MKHLLENVDLMTYKINFNYQKQAVYHSYFGIIISICIYICLIILTEYFTKDLIYKTNPNIINQEIEFKENFTLPMNFIIHQYYYEFFFETKENVYNLTSHEISKVIPNQINPFFSFIINATHNENKTSFEMIEKIDINSTRIIKNGREIFKNFIHKNLTNQKCNLKIYNHTSNKLLHAQDNIFYDRSNITIFPDMMIHMLMIKNKELENVTEPYFEINNHDNIISVDDPNFFKNISKTNDLKFDNNLNILQIINFNYGVVKLIDDTGIIFSKTNQKYSLKNNYQSIVSNYNDIGLIFKLEINSVMKEYERIYKKLQNVFADLGGLFNLLLLIGNLIVVHINKKKFDYDLINKIFFLDDELENLNNIKNNDFNLNKIYDRENIKLENLLKNDINDDINIPKIERKVESIF